MNATHNTLVISDVHLGGDLNVNCGPSARAQLDLLERELIDFLRHYTYTRRDGRPWQLVINGDLIDFLGICLLPDPDSDDDATPEEHIYGLGRRPKAARAKVDAVIERHADVFVALARFARAGNRVDLVAGNHDVELQWDAVQRAFLDGVRRVYERAQLAAGGDPASDFIESAFHFHPWFVYIPGVAWIEHGHLYDENCSFQFALAPADPFSKQIDLNVDTAAQRYVVNRIPAAEHGQENWSWLGYMRWALGLGPRGALEVFKSYYAFSARLIAARRQRRRAPGAAEERRARHRERLRALCEVWSLDERTLDAVHELRRRPVVENLWRLLQVLMIDKLVIGALALLVVMVAVWSLPLAWGLAGAGTVVGSAWAANRILSRGRIVDPTAPLMVIPERILRHVDARYVVFGHTHEAMRVPLEGGGVYFNTGTWYPDEAPGLLRSFTHVVIHCDDDGPRAQLCQWRDGASRPFTPGYSVRTRPATAEPAALPVAAPGRAAA
ncbi:MAG: hypothetical protein D6689_19140 [Deltaproteobacteria bacterium]|nr:MAG: hypothetical protein D6689_19140 [Deltaproteobacteria bacterium]